jgi:cytidyltransferase-like protein
VTGKLKTLDELITIVAQARTEGKIVVFTNGCFDLLHRGHVHLLREAKAAGDLLIVAVNSDRSVKADAPGEFRNGPDRVDRSDGDGRLRHSF